MSILFYDQTKKDKSLFIENKMNCNIRSEVNKEKEKRKWLLDMSRPHMWSHERGKERKKERKKVEE